MCPGIKKCAVNIVWRDEATGIKLVEIKGKFPWRKVLPAYKALTDMALDATQSGRACSYIPRPGSAILGASLYQSPKMYAAYPPLSPKPLRFHA